MLYNDTASLIERFLISEQVEGPAKKSKKDKKEKKDKKKKHKKEKSKKHKKRREASESQSEVCCKYPLVL